MTTSPRPLVLVSIDTSLALPFDGGAEEARVDVRRCRWVEGEDAVTVTDLVGRIVADAPLVVCLGPDVPEPLAIELAESLDRTRPDISIVLLRPPSAELWQIAARAGVRDVVAPDAPPEEIRHAIDQAADRAERLLAAAGVDRTADPGGRVIAVLSPKGGSGKTMVAANLGVALAATRTGDVVIVDLDSVFGDVAGVLGLVPDHTIGQLAGLPSFDSTTLKVFLTRHDRSGAYVLAGSGLPEEGEAVTDAVATQILYMLARDFAYVVVDTAAGLDERALAAAERATDLVLVATLDVASIRNLGKEIDALDRLGMTRAGRHFLLNRADSRVGLEVSDVEVAIGLTAAATLPSSRLVPLTMNEGRPVVLDEPDATVSRELVRFANSLVPDVRASATSRSGRSRFSLRRHGS